MKLINESPNGQIFLYPHNKVVHVEFGNLLVKLTYCEFNQFARYVNSIDYLVYLEKNSHAQNRKKLLLYIGFDEIFLALNESEFLELNSLLSLKQHKMMLKSNQIICGALQLN